MRHFVTTLLAVCVAVCAMAQANRVYIEDFEICPDSVVTVPVMLTNVDETRGVQFRISLPLGLSIDESELTDHSADCNMQELFRFAPIGGFYNVILYPLDRSCLPSGTHAIMNFSFKADAAFKGGTITLFKACGATTENQPIAIDGDSTTVTVPEAVLVGVPVDQKTSDDRFFN